MKKYNKKLIIFVSILSTFLPFLKVNAAEAEAIGATEARISGIGYEINTINKKIVLDSGANVELTGNAENYFIDVNEDATNVVIKLNNYSAVTGGWVNAINLKNRSNVKVILSGDNLLQSGNEASAIRVPDGASLVIDGDGKLTAKVSNGGSAARSAVIGSQYDLNCGNITINGGNITTEFSTTVNNPGIGSGNWHSNNDDIRGNITINGGIINTATIGSAKSNNQHETLINITINGDAIIYAEKIVGVLNFTKGIVFNKINSTAEVKEDVVLNEDFTIPSSVTLTIDAGASLNIPKNVTFINEGEIVNLGSIMNYGSITNKGTLTNTGSINSNTEIQGVTGNSINPMSYEYLDESSLIYTKEQDIVATFRINADYILFSNGGKVYVNDKLLDEENYTSEPGSTIITLKKEYLDTLDPGDYLLKITFSNKAVSETLFTIKNKVVEQPLTNESSKTPDAPNNEASHEIIDSNNPKTNDNIVIPIIVFLVSLAKVALYLKKAVL